MFLKNTIFLANINANSPKHLFQILSDQCSRRLKLDRDAFFQQLMILHKKDPSGIQNGVAMPHGFLPMLRRPLTIIATLQTPVSFDGSLDNEPVDIICLMLSPETFGLRHITMPARVHHLKKLAALSRMMADEDLCARMRGCTEDDALKSVFIAEKDDHNRFVAAA